jgi:hypothetical protein
MKKSKSPVDVAITSEQTDKSAAEIEAEQKEKEKYQSEPEGKVKFGDYIVRAHSDSPSYVETNLYLMTSGSSHMLQNGILCYYFLVLWPP